MGSNILEEIVEERDLRAVIHNTLKGNKPCAKAVNAANSIAGMISRTFICKNKEIILLYKAVV